MKEEEQSTSFLESFDDDEKRVAEILQQFSELVMEYEYNTGFLPLWGSKALRSVLVNIPPPSNKSSQLPLPPLPILPCTESRPPSNGLSPIPESLPFSSNAHPANTRLHPKKKSPKITLMKKRQLLRILEDELIQEAAAIVEPQLELNSISVGGTTSHLIEEDVNGEKETHGGLCREKGSLLEYRIGLDMSNEMRPLPNQNLVPSETLLMGCFIHPIQLNKEAIYAEARRRRKLEMQRAKSSKRPRT
ncbi:hypothetical protein PVL29_024099 [Vitis rotundifolia]|uniref:Uncharacterized protein n=1 Tax=Vitis rotundifolia TaxID=103349 RepID=A0AA38YQX1_VITRO|nr:hypothetical protein PVL29_024099 [Vitis rotundifolia]